MALPKACNILAPHRVMQEKIEPPPLYVIPYGVMDGLEKGRREFFEYNGVQMLLAVIDNKLVAYKIGDIPTKSKFSRNYEEDLSS